MNAVLRDATLYDRVIGSFNCLGLARLRRRLVGPLSGAILERRAGCSRPCGRSSAPALAARGGLRGRCGARRAPTPLR